MAQLLEPGYVQAIKQNIVYALPSCRVLLFTDATTPTIQQSLTEAFTANVALTLSSGQSEVAGAFIKCTTGDINIILKNYK